MNDVPSSSQQSTDVATDSMVKLSNNKEGRKQLPSVFNSSVDDRSLLVTESKPEQGGRNKNAYSSFFLEYSVLGEYAELKKRKVPGVYVIASAKSPLVWHGVLFVRQGMYQGGVFRFMMTIPDNYPDGTCPKLVFDFPVFHPLVEPQTGELDVLRAFPKWRRNTNKLWQVLLYARRIFYKIDTKTPTNPKAAVLYETNLDQFKSMVLETVASSKSRLFEPVTSDDPNYFRFNPWDPSVHEDAHHQMLNLQVNGSGK
ncbi:hypothetical protein ScPMuIL_000073 [Solemya velum]